MKRQIRFSHLVVALSFASVLSVGGVVYLGYRFLLNEFPNVEPLKTQYPVVIYRGRSFEPDVVLKRGRPDSWVSLSQVSRGAVGAIIVSEDWSFYGHKGYDPHEIKEAIKEDLAAGSFVRGASTITQQVAKNVFLSHEKSLWRKFKELILAMELEEKVGKRRILEAYLNVAEWGEGVFGIHRAARVYFGKHPSQLTAKEGAFLAMLLPSPKKYSVSFRARKLTPYARKTMSSIMNKMVRAQYLSPEDRQVQWSTPLSFEAVGAVQSGMAPEEVGEEEADESDEEVSAESGNSAENLTAGRSENEANQENF